MKKKPLYVVVLTSEYGTSVTVNVVADWVQRAITVAENHIGTSDYKVSNVSLAGEVVIDE
jgi:hypothetical protein